VAAVVQVVGCGDGGRRTRSDPSLLLQLLYYTTTCRRRRRRRRRRRHRHPTTGKNPTWEGDGAAVVCRDGCRRVRLRAKIASRALLLHSRGYGF